MNKIPLPPSYHNLADTRKLLNVKNGYNVISNIAVFAPTLYLLQKHNLNTKNKILAFHISLIALTSTYYHLYPTNARIVWDMLSIATTHAVVLSYFVEEKIAANNFKKFKENKILAKRILIMGLPGTGKTTLANELVKFLPIIHLNADEIRKYFDDWDFSKEGRLRQAKRMKRLSDFVLSEGHVTKNNLLETFFHKIFLKKPNFGRK